MIIPCTDLDDPFLSACRHRIIFVVSAAAVKAFGDTKSNNAALAQILTKDYSKAKSTLAAIDRPDATTYYLMAVLGARTNNESMLNTNLRQAIRLDNSLAKRAVEDLEFAKYNLSKALN